MAHKLDDATIEAAKTEMEYMRDSLKGFHEHNDCVRIAYEWLSAQERTKRLASDFYGIKHVVERCGARYVSMNDVELAAHILGIPVKNGRMAISKNGILPCMSRLNYIGQANIHGYSMDRWCFERYSRYEYLPGSTKPISQIPDDIRSYFQTDGTKRKITFI